MFFQVTSQDKVTEMSGSLETVNNGTEIDSLYKRVLTDIKSGKVFLIIMVMIMTIMALLITYNLGIDLNRLAAFDFTPFAVFGFIIVVIVIILIFQIRYQRKITSNFYNYTIYRALVNLENKGVHSDDDGNTYYCDLVSSNGDFTISHVHINSEAYREYNDGYVYIIVDENNKEIIYYSKTILDGSDLY